ncbi:hypothetical protein ACFWAY_39105 [Rhodococcus sp. NPDC059968]
MSTKDIDKAVQEGCKVGTDLDEPNITRRTASRDRTGGRSSRAAEL